MITKTEDIFTCGISDVQL